MLSLPNSQSSSGTPGDPATQGVWNYLSPKRSQVLLARESNIAVREAEVARREAEILAGCSRRCYQPACSAPNDVLPCVPCHSSAYLLRPANPDCHQGSRQRRSAYASRVVEGRQCSPRTISLIENLKSPNASVKSVDVKETVNRREHDASRREAWIMEQTYVRNFGSCSFLLYD